MSQNVGTDAFKLINLAAKQVGALGIGQTLPGEIVQDCFDLLNMMLSEWSEQKNSVYHLLDATINCTGSQTYTVGVGGVVNTPQYPVRIESAYLTMNGVNYPMRVIRSKEDWIRIALPNLSSFPQYIFLDSDYPLGVIHVWPVANNQYTVTFQYMAALQQFAQLTDAVALRPAYLNPIMYNLAVAIAPIFGVEVPRTVAMKATTSKRSMQKANTQIPLLHVPGDVIRRGHYNILSDRSA